MTEPFVTTEYGVSQLSGKQKGSERLGVTKHYPHSCWLYEQQWCTPFSSLPSPSPSPYHPLLLSISFNPLLLHPQTPIAPRSLHRGALFFSVCAILKTTNSTISFAVIFTFLASYYHSCDFRGTRQGLVLHHSYPGKRRGKKDSACTQI